MPEKQRSTITAELSGAACTATGSACVEQSGETAAGASQPTTGSLPQGTLDGLTGRAVEAADPNRTLFELHPAPSQQPAVAGAATCAPGDLEPLAETDDRQLLLFSDLVVLRRDLENAVVAGHLSEARRLRRAAVESYGPGGVAQQFAFVEALSPELWEQPPRVVLSTWRELDGGLVVRPGLRLAVRDAVFRRLLDQHDPGALAREAPDVVGPLYAALASPHRAGGRASARALVRDLLLEGRELWPDDFQHDGTLADLLGEHLPATWLACLGALRRLWPVPPASPAMMASFGARALVSPSSEAEAAREFWTCLRLTRTADVPERVLHEARRRMRALNPDMHALHMGAARAPRPASAGELKPGPA